MFAPAASAELPSTLSKVNWHNVGQDLSPGIRSWEKLLEARRPTFPWELVSVFPGSQERTATAGIAGTARENLCDALAFTGYTVDGGYAEYTVARNDFVFPLPKTLDDLHAAPLLCAGIIGFRSLRVAGVDPGERVGLFGFGASAHLWQASPKWRRPAKYRYPEWHVRSSR